MRGKLEAPSREEALPHPHGPAAPATRLHVTSGTSSATCGPTPPATASGSAVDIAVGNCHSLRRRGRNSRRQLPRPRAARPTQPWATATAPGGAVGTAARDRLRLGWRPMGNRFTDAYHRRPTVARRAAVRTSPTSCSKSLGRAAPYPTGRSALWNRTTRRPGAPPRPRRVGSGQWFTSGPANSTGPGTPPGQFSGRQKRARELVAGSSEFSRVVHGSASVASRPS